MSLASSPLPRRAKEDTMDRRDDRKEGAEENREKRGKEEECTEVKTKQRDEGKDTMDRRKKKKVFSFALGSSACVGWRVLALVLATTDEGSESRSHFISASLSLLRVFPS